MTERPTRHARDADRAAVWAKDARMVELARRNRRQATPPEGSSEPRLVTALTVEVWEETDGSESIIINGTNTGTLEAKGVLHDALWALIHSPKPA